MRVMREKPFRDSLFRGVFVQHTQDRYMQNCSLHKENYEKALCDPLEHRTFSQKSEKKKSHVLHSSAMLYLRSLKHHMWILEESIGLIRASFLNLQGDLDIISEHMEHFFTL